MINWLAILEFQIYGISTFYGKKLTFYGRKHHFGVVCQDKAQNLHFRVLDQGILISALVISILKLVFSGILSLFGPYLMFGGMKSEKTPS